MTKKELLFDGSEESVQKIKEFFPGAKLLKHDLLFVPAFDRDFKLEIGDSLVMELDNK